MGSCTVRSPVPTGSAAQKVATGLPVGESARRQGDRRPSAGKPSTVSSGAQPKMRQNCGPSKGIVHRPESGAYGERSTKSSDRTLDRRKRRANMKDKPETIRFFRRRLPHWLVAERAYFVTLRLHGTLPRHVAEELRAQRKPLSAEKVHDDKRIALQDEQFNRIERILDSLKWPDEGLCQRDVGTMMLDSLDWLRGRGWTIYAAVLMGTHSHLLLLSSNGNSANLVPDLDAFKSYTGREANRLRQQSGRFWARDTFDHWVRDAKAFDGYVRYIANNPVRAGLVNAWHNWRWTVVDEEVMDLV